METLKLEKDITVYCITAESFPNGVLKAHETLHQLIPFDNERKYFGISRPGSEGGIIYKAAAEELQPGELSKHQLETFTIQKGNYVYIDVKNYMQNVSAIGDAFQKMIHDDRIDPNGACVEWYIDNKLCRCMVKLS